MCPSNSPADEVLSLSEAAAAVPTLKGRKKLHPSSIWRWCRRGVKTRTGTRVRLRHARYGGTLGVKRADLDAFFKELAEADLAHFDGQENAPPAPTTFTKGRSPSAKRVAMARANAILDEAGV